MSSYKNPVIKGFNPDPSVVLVDGIYYAVCSSFQFFPGIPVYASYDLINWAQIGNVIHSNDQGVDLSVCQTHVVSDEDVHQGGIFAATIRYHKGRFYVISTNTVPQEKGTDFKPYNFICHTDDIWNNQWSKVSNMDYFYAIDPSLFWDDDDKCYVQGAFIYGYDLPIANSIHQFEINPDTGEKLSEEYEICSGWSKVISEGPHIYKKDDYYYMVFAEGGTYEDHMLCVARSKTIKGPFEPWEQNPLASNRKTDEYVQWVGHGELFQDANGDWWGMLLACRGGATDSHPLSRETFLTPIDWPHNGWPKAQTIKVDMVTDRKLPPTNATIKNLVPEWFKKDLFAKNFFIRNPVMANYEFDYEKKLVTLHPEPTGLSGIDGSTTFIGKRQPDLESEFESTIYFSQSTFAEDVEAGITVYKDPPRYYTMGIKKGELFVFAKTLKSQKIVHQQPIDVSDSVTLKITSTEKEYKFWVKKDTFEHVITLNTADLSAMEFTGAIYGNYTYGTSGSIVFSDIQ